MGLLATLRNALGLGSRRSDPPAPFMLTEAGLRRLAALPQTHALHVVTVPAPGGGRVVQVDEGKARSAVANGLEGPVVIDERDRERLFGLALDYTGDRWRVVLHLDVWASDTPNPNGRLYELSRPIATGRALFYDDAASAPELARKLLAIANVRAVLLRGSTLTVERTPELPWPPIDQAVDAALREYFLLCGKPVDGGAEGPRTDALEQEVQKILDERVLPMVHADGGDLQLVDIRDGVARIAMTGACRSCPASLITVKAGVEKALREGLPGRIHTVVAV